MVSLSGVNLDEVQPLLDRMAEEDFLGQLLLRSGRAAELATEAGDVKLDWVDGVEMALAHPESLAQVEREAQDILQKGIRHVLWAGMGGSVQAVYTLKRLGFLDSPLMKIHPCDSTDPASLNRLLHEIADDQVELSERALRQALSQTMMVGVAMGMTSEEPITHLRWFDGLLSHYGISPPSDHIQVMTIPGSYLDKFASARGARRLPIQLDGENHTPGRMSAPATRVFLIPVALMLTAAQPEAEPTGDLIGAVLRRCQELYGVTHAMREPKRRQLARCHPFVQLGAYLALETEARRRNKVETVLPKGWEGLVPWVEQLVEESLGKGGDGFLIFSGNEPLEGDGFRDDTLVLNVNGGAPDPAVAALRTRGVPVLDLAVTEGEGVPDLGELAALMAGFKLTVAAFGYLHDIVFVGQPAVEAYKKYARELRDAPVPVPFPDTLWTAQHRSLKLYYSSPLEKALTDPLELEMELADLGGSTANAADVYAALLSLARRKGILGYKDFTFNGELTGDLSLLFQEAKHELCNQLLGVRCKVRTGPSDYHSTEQSEVDGPSDLVSTRFVALHHEPVLAGEYDDKFLLAQARGTWQAMEDAGRWVMMITMPEVNFETVSDIRHFFREVAARLRKRTSAKNSSKPDR